jgi:hypothetical protein
LFKFLPRKIQTNKRKKAIFSSKVKINFSKSRKQYLHSGDFIKSEAFHKGTLNNSYKLNHCFSANITNTLSIYRDLSKFCFTLPFLLTGQHQTAFAKVASLPSPSAFLTSSPLPFFMFYNKCFSPKLSDYRGKIIHVNRPTAQDHPHNFGIRTNVFSSWCLLTITRGAARLFFTKKVFGTYIVTKDSFFANDVYFPSPTNIRTFNNLVAFKTTKGLNGFEPTTRSG